MRRWLPNLRPFAKKGHGGWHPEDPEKRRHLADLLAEGRIRTFIESGTYLGDTVAFMSSHAARIISIEVEPTLADRARRRFQSNPRVEIILGDSAEVLPRILSELHAPVLVWLDGHWSGGITGSGKEVEPAVSILHSIGASGIVPGSRIVVDDLRLFGTDPLFPKLVDLIRAAEPLGVLSVAHDALVIRVE